MSWLQQNWVPILVVVGTVLDVFGVKSPLASWLINTLKSNPPPGGPNGAV